MIPASAIRFFLLLFSVAVMSGCATVPPGSQTIDLQARSLRPPADQSGIYIFRPALPPSDALWPVNLDAHHFGYLAPKSYLYGVVQPGPHSLDLAYPDSTVTFEAGPNENSYFKITLGFPGAVLTRITADTAQELLEDATLSGFNIFENDAFRQQLENQPPR